MKTLITTLVAVTGLLVATSAAQAANMWAGGGSSSKWNTTNVIWSAVGSTGPFDLAWNNTTNASDIAIFDGTTGLTSNGKFDINADIVVGGIKILNDSDVYGFTGNKTVTLGAGGLDFDLANTSHNNQKFQNPDFVLSADQTWKIRQDFKIQTSTTLDINGKMLQIDMTDDDSTARTLGDDWNVFPVLDTSGTPGVFQIIGGNVARVDFSSFAGTVQIDTGALLNQNYSDAQMSSDLALAINGTGLLDIGEYNYTVESLTVDGTSKAAGDYTATGNDWLSGTGTLTVAIPEPASMALLAAGGLMMVRRRR